MAQDRFAPIIGIIKRNEGVVLDLEDFSLDWDMVQNEIDG